MRDITKPRILYIYKYLLESSSRAHPVSKRDIMDKLQNDHGLSVNRITLINDLKMLMEAGILNILVQRNCLSGQQETVFPGQRKPP